MEKAPKRTVMPDSDIHHASYFYTSLLDSKPLKGILLSMNSHRSHTQAIRYLFIAIVTFLALQSLIVVVHEFTHSTMAWLLGDMKSPLGIVWGNSLTMTGWDEGVDYDHIFSQGRNIQATIIGFCPLIMHSIVAGLGIFFMGRQWLNQRKWLFHIVYWLVVVNLMELVAYVYMRSFSGHGDIGIFDRGTGISPWWIFIIGSIALSWGLFLLFRHCLPRLQTLLAQDSPPTMWTMLVTTSFVLFLWGSGIRVMAYVSGPQWMFGLIGIPAFLFTVILFRPKHIQ